MPSLLARRPHPGREALASARRVLDARPRKDDDALTAATRQLAALRCAMVAARRDGTADQADGQRLSRLNAVISVVMSMHFPIGTPPWAEFAKAVSWLESLVAEVEG